MENIHWRVAALAMGMEMVLAMGAVSGTELGKAMAKGSVMAVARFHIGA